MENEKRINWLGLFIKIIIVFIFALIIIWLVSKIINNNKLSEKIKNNIDNMEKVSIDYFKTIDLPLEKGESIKITLEELIEKELIISENSESKIICDTKESYSKITRAENKYVVTTTLKCGKAKETIKKDFPLKDCKNCNQASFDKNNSEESNVNNNTNNNSSSKLTYYEYIKETPSYTKWMRGSLTGNNIENKYEYYGIDNQTYYTLGVIPTNKKTITYTMKLDSVPNEKYYFTTVDNVDDFNKDEESNYLNEKNVSIYKGNKPNISKNISDYSLNESNLSYELSPYYNDGSFFIRITTNITNTDGIKSYYDSKLKDNVYLIPLKINIKFTSDYISETKPEGNYETISYYRYVTSSKDIKWSTETSLEGYTKTGNTKVQ